jgi:hypothetical protein
VRPIRLKVRGRSRPGSLIEGIHAIKTQKNFAVNVLKKYMRISDPEILQEAYQYALRFIQPRPFPTLEETKAVLDELKRQRPSRRTSWI